MAAVEDTAGTDVVAEEAVGVSEDVEPVVDYLDILSDSGLRNSPVLKGGPLAGSTEIDGEPLRGL